jgi:hypothetical protein
VATRPLRPARPYVGVNVEVVAGVVLIVAPLWFNTSFALLGKRFDYPDILRRPTPEILDRFRAGGPGLILLWWTFMLSGVLLIVAAVLLGQVLGLGSVVLVATTFGVLAGLHLVGSDRRWCRPGSCASHVAGLARHRHRCGVGGRLGGVPRPQ